MKKYAIMAMSCLLCIVWVGLVDAEGRRDERSEVSMKRLKRVAKDVPAMDRAESRRRRAIVTETNVRADTKEQMTNAIVNEKIVKIRTSQERSDAEFAYTQENVRAKEQRRQASLSKSEAEIQELSRQAEIGYERGLSMAKLEKEVSLNEAQKLEASLAKKKIQNAAELARLQKGLEAYVTATQARISRLAEEIETTATEETAKFTDLRKQAASVSIKVSAKTERLRQETKGYEQNSIAGATKLKADASALGKNYQAEVSKLRSEASSLEKQETKDNETEEIRIGRLEEKYAADVTKLRADAETAQAVLSADMESMAAEITHYEKAELAEIASLKEVLENDLANKNKEIVELQAAADALQQETDAEEVYQKVKAQSEQVRIDGQKEIEVVGAVAEAKALTSEWKAEERILAQEERKAAEAAESARKRVGAQYSRAGARRRDASVPRVLREEDVVLTSAAGDNPGRDLAIGKASMRGIDVDGMVSIEKNRIKIEALCKEVDAKKRRLGADREEVVALIEAKQKKLTAEIGRRTAMMTAEHTARQANIELMKTKSNKLEAAYKTDVARLHIANVTTLKKLTSHVALLRAEADKIQASSGADMATMLATADAIEVNTPIEVKNRMTAISSLAIQGAAMSSRLIAEADVIEASMAEVLIAKNAQIESDRKVMGAVAAATKSEIESKTELASAEERILTAEIAASRAVAGADEQKLIADLENAKAQRGAVIAERQKLLGIQDSLYAAEIQQLLAQSESEKAMMESAIAIDEATMAAIEKTNMDDVQALRVQADTEEQMILADMEAGKASARAKKIREEVEMTLVQASAVAGAETAAADAEKQNHLAGQAHIRARDRLGVIRHILEVKRVFEDEEAPISISDYSKRERADLMSSSISPLPTLDEILAE